MKKFAIVIASALSACVAQPVMAHEPKLMTGSESAMHVAQNNAVVAIAAAKVTCREFMSAKQMDEFISAIDGMGFSHALLHAEADMQRRIGHLPPVKSVCVASLEMAASALEEVVKTPE